MKLLLIRTRLTLFTIISIIGLYFLWDPVYLLFVPLVAFIFSTVGHDASLHRYYAHQSFTCNKFSESILWLCSFVSGTSDPLSYAQRHARHHKFSDTEFDNLQPTKHPFLTWINFGLVKATPVDVSTLNISSKLANSQFHQFVHKHYFVLYYSFVVICLIINFKLAFYFLILTPTIVGHLGSAVSVIGHKYGYRNFDTNDSSTNNTILNIVTGGSGLHNNHHAHPYAYTSKVNTNESDFIGWMIKNIFADKVVELKQ